MYNPTTIPTLTFKQGDTGFYAFQFPTRQMLPIHSSHRKKSASPFHRTPISPFKPRGSPESKPQRQIQSSMRQRGPRKIVEPEKPEKQEHRFDVVGFNDRMARYRRNLDTSSGYLSPPAAPSQNSSMIVISSASGNVHLKPKTPFRTGSSWRTPVKMIAETDDAMGGLFSEKTLKLKSEGKKDKNVQSGDLEEGRYSNIRFMMNDRSRSQVDIKYPVTPSDTLITATDPRFQTIEAVMREYSLDLVPESCQYIISQNSQTQNYLVVFTDKSIPVCKQCLLPVYLDLSFNYGLRIFCRSSFCQSRVLHNSKLTSLTIQSLWSIDYPAYASVVESKNIIEKQEVSKAIQNGAFRHRDITRMVTKGTTPTAPRRPATSMGPSNGQKKFKEISPMNMTLYPSKLDRGQREEVMVYRKQTDVSIEENKDFLSEVQNGLGRYRLPGRVKSTSVSKNTSIRDDMYGDSKKFLDGSLLNEFEDMQNSRVSQGGENKHGSMNQLNLIGKGVIVNDTPMKGGKKVKYTSEHLWSSKPKEPKEGKTVNVKASVEEIKGLNELENEK